jgi:hypothetical protein
MKLKEMRGMTITAKPWRRTGSIRLDPAGGHKGEIASGIRNKFLHLRTGRNPYEPSTEGFSRGEEIQLFLSVRLRGVK